LPVFIIPVILEFIKEGFSTRSAAFKPSGNVHYVFLLKYNDEDYIFVIKRVIKKVVNFLIISIENSSIFRYNIDD